MEPTTLSGAGNDSVYTYSERFPSSRDNDADRAIGGPGKDDLHSNGGADVLRGGGDNDELWRLADGGGLIEGGPGNDYMRTYTNPESLAANVPAKAEHMAGGTGADKSSSPTNPTPSPTPR